MMKLGLRSLFFILIIVAYHTSHAQCNGRYSSEIFTSYTLDSVVYTIDSGVSIKMDIYQPVGDSQPTRPVIVLAHGGSFVTSQGDRHGDPAILTMCQTFAKRGYVTATIDYRTTPNLTDLVDSIKALNVVMRAIGDGKAAVRFFRKDAYTTNRYMVDTNQIFIGGNSAGAILSVHLAYIDSLAQVPGYIQAVINSNGGIEGNSGNQGYSSRVKAVINLAGGINNLAWYTPGDVPMVSCQGDSDNVVPYNCDGVLKGTTMGLIKTVNICGGGAMKDWANSIGGVEDTLLTFPGDKHTPWEFDTTKMNKVIAFVDSFMVRHTDCYRISGIDNVNEQVGVAVFPNPATSAVTIKPNFVGSYTLSMFNTLGQVIVNTEHLVGSYQLNTSHLLNGVYLVRITDGNNLLIHTTRLMINH